MRFLFLLSACTATEEAKEPPTPPERVVIHEVFSGSNCGPCAPAAENLFAALADMDGKYSIIKYQLGSDPYITAEAVNRRMLYLPGESTYEIPFVHADGIGFHPNNMDENETPYSAEDFQAFHSEPSILGIELEVEFDAQTVDISVRLEPWEDISAENLRLLVSINEKTTHENIGSNGQTEFHHVLKKFIPDESGTLLDPLLAGDTSSHSFEYTFAGEYDEAAGFGSMVDHEVAHTVEDFGNLEVLVWVQDMETWEVFNSAWTGHK